MPFLWIPACAGMTACPGENRETGKIGNYEIFSSFHRRSLTAEVIEFSFLNHETHEKMIPFVSFRVFSWLFLHSFSAFSAISVVNSSLFQVKE